MSVEVTSRANILSGWLDLETTVIEMNLGREIRKVIFKLRFCEKKINRNMYGGPSKEHIQLF